MASSLSIPQRAVAALLAATAACESQPTTATISGNPGSVVDVSGSATPDSGTADLLPASACRVGDLVFWPKGNARPWPFGCSAPAIPHELKARGPGSQVVLSGSLLIPNDQTSGQTVIGELAGYVTVAYRTSSVMKEVFGPGEFATRRARIRYPLSVQIVAGNGPRGPAGLTALDSLFRTLPPGCVKYLRTGDDDKERFWRLALMLVAAPRGLPIPGTGTDCVH